MMCADLIKCDLHDYIEIACTFRYPVLLSLDSGKEINSKAFDIVTKPDKTEYLLLLVDGSNDPAEVPLTELKQMQALIDNPHFDKVDF